VLVYDAMTEQLKQEARVHSVNGHWRVALMKGKHYRLAITAPGYTYHYIDIRTDSLAARAEQSVGTIALEDQLTLRLNGYDTETQQTVYKQLRSLPLGQLHSVRIQQKGYEDTTLVINTKRPTVFSETELDIPLHPLKSRHLFIVTNAQTDEMVENATLRLNGQPTKADTALRLDQELALQVSAPGYLFYDTLLNTGQTAQQATIRIRLVPIEKGMVLQLRNIQFEYDSYELTESSNEALEALAQLMLINPTLRIELSAHTDDQGSDRYNDKLSTLRGESVASWLIQRGIEGERIESVGYGKRKPLVANDSEENRAINRRVEIKVLEF
jgi:outer membrane protein OmpA-like peptidoglycan-associated protein